MGLNCAVCHTGTVRETPTSAAQIVLGMPAHQLDLQRLFDGVLGCTLDERLTVDNLLGKIKESGGHLGLIEGLLYRTALLNQVRTASLRQQGRSGVLLSSAVPAWGRGRVDTFNPYKAIQFNWSLKQLPPAELIGAADLPSLWNQQPREGMQLHWDGDNSSVDERNLSAALGAGVTPVTVDHDNIKRVRDWIWTLPPPKYPYAIEASRAASGEAIYARLCAECHSFGGKRTGSVVDIDDIGTDPHRLNSYTHIFAANQAALFPESRYRFTHFRKTHGYANHPLDGIWARAPYLHNGSVPTLWDLLQSPDGQASAVQPRIRCLRQRKGRVHLRYAGSQTRRLAIRYHRPRQWERGPRLWDAALRRGEASVGRVHENAVGVMPSRAERPLAASGGI